MSNEEQLVIVVVQATTVSKMTDLLMKRISNGEVILQRDCAETMTEIRARLEKALCAARSLELTALGVPKPKLG